MRHSYRSSSLALASLFVVFGLWMSSNHSVAEDEAAAAGQEEPGAATPAAEQPSTDEMQKMMEEWTKTMTPGPAHAKLEPLIGEWETTTKMWWGGPDTPAIETKGTATNEWILGKRYVLSRYNSEMKMPGPDGQMVSTPFEGFGVTGYDNYRKMYTGNWMDSMGTAMSISKGSMDPDGKKMRQYGEMDEPMLGVIGRFVKYETVITDNDHYTMSIYDLHAGDDYKVLEVAYTRKK